MYREVLVVIRGREEAGKRWIDARLSVLATNQHVALTGITWRIDHLNVFWVTIHKADAAVSEGFREQDLEELPTDVGLQAQVEERLAACVVRLYLA